MSKFVIERSAQTGQVGELFLKDDTTHCHSYWIICNFLSSKSFRDNNQGLIPVFEKAKQMMEAGQTGAVIVETT